MATITGTSGNDTLNGTSGDDTLNGLGGNDELFGSGGNDFYDGGTGSGDTLNLKFTSTATVVDFAAGTISGGFTGTFVNMEYVNAGDGNDHLIGTAGIQNLSGRAGNDTLESGTGNDSLWGGGGNDTFLFHEAGTANADKFFDFASGLDKIAFDGTALSGLGAEGNFSAGDARFAANTSGTAQDSSDRIIYETDTRQIWYDPDGTGAAARQLIGTLQSGATLTATDIVVQGGGTSSGGTNGTEGNDTLTGTPGNDTINGLGGNDSISGLGGDDSLSGGSGNDTLIGGPGTDTLDGGVGNDTYVTGNGSISADPDVVSDAGGVDTLIAFNAFAPMPSGIENLTLEGGPFDPGVDIYVSSGNGNELNNLIVNHRPGSTGLDGGIGNDTLIGTSSGTNWFEFSSGGTGNYGNDVVDGNGGGAILVAPGNGVTVNFQTGIMTGGGTGSVSFTNIHTAQGSGAADLMIGNDSGVHLYGDAGNDTLAGGSGNDFITGDGFITSDAPEFTTGNDSISAGAGDDTVQGGLGDDTLNGGAGRDALGGDEGNDQFLFDQVGSANADNVTGFASGEDEIHLDATVMTALGASGEFAANDARFFEAAGASAGHDADDRVVYDTSSGNLWYDADGSGGQAAQLVATLDGPASLVATDIFVDNGSTSTMPGGQHLVGTSNNDSIVGGEGNDTIEGLGGFDTLVGAGGDDSLAGASGWDTLTGGAGEDTYAFTEFGHGMNDHITDFASGSDVIELDPSVFTAIGASGAFTVNDPRFYAAPGASAGHDADDRIIYDTSSGIVYYDPDGSGSAAQANLAILDGRPTLAATDFVVKGEAPPPPPPPSGTFDNTNEVIVAPLSGDSDIDALLGSFFVAWDRLTPTDSVIQYTFSVTEGQLSSYSATAFSSDEESWARQALGEAASITGIRFEEVSDGNAADLHFAHSTNLGTFSGFFTNTSNITLDSDGQLTHYDADGYVYARPGAFGAPGTTGYQLLLHELGHALGLSHPHDAPILLSPALDDNHHTVMTYNNVYAPVSTYQPLDVAALQWLYGGDGLGGRGAYADGTQPQFGSNAAESLVGGAGDDYLDGRSGADTLIGAAGNDLLVGQHGVAEVLNGGDGDDYYFVDAMDALFDSSGNDTVASIADWTLAGGFENLTLAMNTLASLARGNEANNVIAGNDNANVLVGLAGDDALYGRAGDDRFDMSFAAGSSYGNDTVDGGLGVDTLDFSAAASAVTVDLNTGTVSGGGTGGGGSVQCVNIECVIGSTFDDRITALSGPVSGVLQGGAGRDTLTGGDYTDGFEYTEAPGTANADVILNFTSGLDFLSFDGDVYARIGVSNFTATDDRFYAAAGATSAHDATDRIVYDTVTGDVYYDADGSGSGAAQIVASLQGAPTLDGWQIHVVNGHPEAGQVIDGTDGNDTLVGASGNDTLNGLGGDDSISGNEGNDSLSGGNGNDTLEPGPGDDTVDGGLGDDTYIVTGDTDPARSDANDVLTDAGGIDKVVSHGDWVLGAGFENLDFGGGGEDASGGTGNELDNVITALGGGFLRNYIDGGAGDDTLIGAFNGENNFFFRLGTGDYGDDSIVGGDDALDSLSFGSDARSALVIDLRAGTLTGGGIDGSGSATLSSIEDATGGAFDDLLIAHDGHNVDTASFAAFVGAVLDGQGGDDTLVGGAADDTLIGGAGADTFVFNQAPGAVSADRIDFHTGSDKIRLDASVMTALGSSGDFVANDPRFFAADGANGGHDADDRVVYDTSTGHLLYDADGSGGQAAQLIAMLGSSTPLAAADIAVVNGTTSPGESITGSNGDDTLTGTDGDDTLEGFAGNDSLDGGNGADLLIGGDGNDTLDGSLFNSATPDTLSGGLGDDRFEVDHPGDVISDDGGVDTVVAFDTTWTLGGGLENLILDPDSNELRGVGNELDNRLTITNSFGGRLEGAGGNDTLVAGFHAALLFGDDGDDNLVGGASFDRLDGGAGNDTLNGGPDFDSLTGGAGADTFIYDARGSADEPPQTSDRVLDFASGVDGLILDARVLPGLGESGTLAADDPRFFAAAGAAGGHDADDRLVYDTSTGQLYYDEDGNGAGQADVILVLNSGTSVATLAAPDITIINGTSSSGQTINGTPGNDALTGTGGDDTISGLDGFDTLVGAGGNDMLAGGSGWDTMTGGAGEDAFVFANYGKGMNDRVTDFVSGSDAIQLDPDIFSAIGASGRFSANDARFYAAAGASAGHDADDRIIYDTSSGTLYYDPDGSGRAAQANIGTLQGAAALVATDILVQSAGMGGGAHLVGGGGSDSLLGSGGADTLEGFGGNDSLQGGAGADHFVFHELGTGNADHVMGFVSGADNVDLDNAVMSALGADGAFASGDGRFFAAAGASGGHDANDRVVYNQSTGQLYYDDDGSGSHAAQLIATLDGTPSLSATDIHVI